MDRCSLIVLGTLSHAIVSQIELVFKIRYGSASGRAAYLTGLRLAVAGTSSAGSAS